jgi:hypothetical protein
VEQQADVVILACGALETARLMLLSQSGRFPNGIANGSDLVGRNVTFHEYSAAVATFEDPIYAWAGGGYVSASSFQFYEHDESRGFAGGGHMACAGVGIPLPINWSLPDRPAWGAGAKAVDREFFAAGGARCGRASVDFRPTRTSNIDRLPHLCVAPAARSFGAGPRDRKLDQGQDGRPVVLGTPDQAGRYRGPIGEGKCHNARMGECDGRPGRHDGDGALSGDHRQAVLCSPHVIVGALRRRPALLVERPERTPAWMQRRGAGKWLVKDVGDLELMRLGESVAGRHDDVHGAGIERQPA